MNGPDAVDRTADASQAPELSALDELLLLFPRTINGMGRHVHAINAAALKDVGPRHCAALRFLIRQPLTVGALAGALEVTLPTASGILGVLDQHGLIVRTADPDDRRRTIVDVAPGRRDEVVAWLADLGAPLAATLEGLTEDEVAAFVRAMRRFAATVSPDELGPPASCVVPD